MDRGVGENGVGLFSKKNSIECPILDRVLMGSVVGEVFQFPWPTGMGVFVIRHHKPELSVTQRPSFSFVLQ